MDVNGMGLLCHCSVSTSSIFLSNRDFTEEILVDFLQSEKTGEEEFRCRSTRRFLAFFNVSLWDE